MKALLSSLAVLSLVLRVQAYEPGEFKGEEGTLLYQLLKPDNYDPAKKYPLVVLLHGAGERGNDNKAQLKWGSSLFTRPEIKEKYPAFVLVPQCPKDMKWVEMDWGGDDGTAPADPGPTQKLLLGTIDALQKQFSNMDPDRYYLTGLSMGGYGTWDLITRHPGKWAAAAPICGGGDKSKAALAKPVPVWTFHGEVDNVVKPIRTKLMADGLKAAGGNVVHTVYAGIAHDSWSSAFAEPSFVPWLFAQKRGEPAKMELATSRLTALAMPAEKVFPGVGPLQLADWFKKLWMQRRVQFEKDKERENGAVVFFGDSITQGWGSLASDFPKWKVANRGISGDTSRGLRYRLREDVMDLQPKAVSILIGTNDLALGGEPEQVIENIKAIVAELQKQNANVPIIINRVMPRGPQPGRFPEKIQKLNGLIDRFVASDKRLALCDAWSIFDDGTGSCKKDEFPDMLHPNKDGYAKWKTALEAVFAKLAL